jgi:hypothetical protein
MLAAQMMEKQTIESVDERLVNFTRFVLALSGLIIIYIDRNPIDSSILPIQRSLSTALTVPSFTLFPANANQPFEVFLFTG